MEKTKEKPSVILKSVCKTILDYSNTIIYKITCNDAKVPDKYVGHTTDFVKRKYTHKHTTTNVKSDSYKLKLYVTIRENGGWSNWRMEIVGFYNCLDLHEAKIKEQEHFVVLNANLNSIEPVPTRNEKIVCTIPINKHNDMQPNLGKFNCENCHYTCRNKCDYNKHLSTRKHLNASKTANKSPKHFACEICNKTYIHRSSLCKHKKTCKQNSASSPNITGSIQEASPRTSEIEILSNLVKELIKSNQETQLQTRELQKHVIELCKNGTHNTTNSNNKSL